MSVHMITGHLGYAHVQPQDEANMNNRMIGEGRFTFNSSMSYKKTNNVLSITAKGLMIDGRRFDIDAENVTITTGTAGLYRKDRVVLTYTMNMEDADKMGVESAYLEVIRGTPANSKASAVLPAYVDAAIDSVNTFAQIPLYNVEINETTIENITSLIGSKNITMEQARGHIADKNIHITSTERTNWNDANSKKHTHSNKSIIDKINQTLLDNWSAAYTHISDAVKHITADERTKWNQAASPVDNLNETSTGKNLDAHQGYVLNEMIGQLNSNLDGLENDCLTLQNTPLKNGLHLGNTGDFSAFDGYKCSEFHEITPNTPIKLELNTDNDDWGLLFYDENKTYLGRSNSVLVTSGKSIETTTPQNAKYATFNIHIYNGNYPIPKLYTTKIGRVVSNLNQRLYTLEKCKNLLNPTLQTTTLNGVTCTNNGDGTYTLNGTSTEKIYFFVGTISTVINNGKTFKLTGCPVGGSTSTYKVSITDTANTESVAVDYGTGVIKTIKKFDNTDVIHTVITIESGVTLNNVVFKPMLTSNLSATYDDFVPYTGDGETLTADVAELKNDLADLQSKVTGLFSLDGTTLTITTE